MEGEVTATKELSFMEKFTGVFTAPRTTFESLDTNPTWFIPFLIIIVLTMASQYLVLDIQLQDQMAAVEARDLSDQQIEAAKQQMSGPMKYIGFGIIPFAVLIIWVILAGIFVGAGNMMISSEAQATFKKMLSLLSWGALISLIQIPLTTLLTLMKGTARGVALDLSVLMETPPIGETPSTMYLILSKFDVFTIWSLILWTIGFSVFYKVSNQKAAVPVVIMWVIWIVVSVAFKSFFGQFGM